MTGRIKWGEPVTGLDGVIAAMQGMKEGKAIQVMQGGVWADIVDPLVLSLHHPYRIGEEVKPREFWVNVYSNGYVQTHESKYLADAKSNSDRIECIHVREVIE